MFHNPIILAFKQTETKSTQQFVNGYGIEVSYIIIYPCSNIVAFSTYQKGWSVDQFYKA
jgi:hypothetical protein